MNRLNKLLILLIVTTILFTFNVFIFAEPTKQNKNLKELEKFDPESSNVKDKAEIIQPEILDNSANDDILKKPPVTGDKNIIIPNNQIDSGILKPPSDNIVK